MRKYLRNNADLRKDSGIMFVSENLTVNEKGHLAVSGVDTVELAKEYGR